MGDPLTLTLPDGPGSRNITGEINELQRNYIKLYGGLVLVCVLTPTIFYSISLQFR